MKQKSNIIPKILGFLALALAIIAFISTIPIEILFYDWSSTEIMQIFSENLIHAFQSFLICIILPVVLILIPRENGKKIAIVFFGVSVIAILTQLFGNVINALVTIAELKYDPFIGQIIGSQFLNGFACIFKYVMSGWFSFASLLSYVGMIISSLLYMLVNVVCLVGFALASFKKNKK